jgi:hypothetical protein
MGFLKIVKRLTHGMDRMNAEKSLAPQTPFNAPMIVAVKQEIRQEPSEHRQSPLLIPV